MAGVRFAATTGQISTGASSRRTMIQIIALSNHRVEITEIQISFEGTSNTDAPIECVVEYQGDAGTTPVALTPVKLNSSDDESLQVTAGQGAWAVEPASGNDLMKFFVHPQTGYTWQAPFGGELVIPGGSRLGVYTNTGLTVDCVVHVLGRE